MRSDRRNRTAGFTLIEVLVALAIIAFGLVAVFGQVSQSASAAARLRDKTLANWVAINTLTEMRLRGDFPGVGIQSDDVEMANVRWRYEIRISETASDALRRADVTVALDEDPERPLATAIGFLAQADEDAGIAATGTGWPLVSPDGQAAVTPPAGNGTTRGPDDGRAESGGQAQ